MRFALPALTAAHAAVTQKLCAARSLGPAHPV